MSDIYKQDGQIRQEPQAEQPAAEPVSGQIPQDMLERFGRVRTIDETPEEPAEPVVTQELQSSEKPEATAPVEAAPAAPVNPAEETAAAPAEEAAAPAEEAAAPAEQMPAFEQPVYAQPAYEQPAAAPQSAYAPPAQPPKKKSGAGKIIGIIGIVLGSVIAGILLTVYLLLPVLGKDFITSPAP
ncbi:MAG: hypothetical protein IJP03_00800, partial [Christensenellaceae bacterium]|nr:hypothetical protein [Christensenellaceae bacterium]